LFNSFLGIISGPEDVPSGSTHGIGPIAMAAGEGDTELVGSDPLEIGCSERSVVPITTPIAREWKMYGIEHGGQRATDWTGIAVTFANVMQQRGSERRSIFSKGVLHPLRYLKGVSLINRILLPEQ
jgi:hypothetical protein